MEFTSEFTEDVTKKVSMQKMVIFFFILKKKTQLVSAEIKNGKIAILPQTPSLSDLTGSRPVQFSKRWVKVKNRFQQFASLEAKMVMFRIFVLRAEFADRFFLNSVNLILKLFSLPHWLTSKFLLYPTFCLKVFHCDEFLKCYSKGILRIFIQRGIIPFALQFLVDEWKKIVK